MNTNEIMNNWIAFTGFNTVADFYDSEDSGSGYITDCTICAFCEVYGYDIEVYNYLDKSY